MAKQKCYQNFVASVFILEPEGEIPKLKDKIVCEKLMDLDISITYVYKKLNNFKISKSSGPDGVHSRVLKLSSVWS